jgi:hypothetical protein
MHAHTSDIFMVISDTKPEVEPLIEVYIGWCVGPVYHESWCMFDPDQGLIWDKKIKLCNLEAANEAIRKALAKWAEKVAK